MCQVSHVFLFFFYKVVELVGGGFVFNGLTSSSFIMFVSSQAVRQSGSQAVRQSGSVVVDVLCQCQCQ